jgi:hypothetical protein
MIPGMIDGCKFEIRGMIAASICRAAVLNIVSWKKLMNSCH